MVQAWYMDEDESDRKASHQTNPPQFVSLDKLLQFGVHYWHVQSPEQVNNIAAERGYEFNDEIACSRECLPNFDVMTEKFYQEHLHTDDETRLVLDGSGYFDIRDPTNDKWIRIHVVKDDFISIPPGLYHRFTVDHNNYIRAKRFFTSSPNWTPYNRGDGHHPSRNEYIQKHARNQN